MIMKKVLLSILLTLLPILASAEIVEIDGIWYNLYPQYKTAGVIKNPYIDSYSGEELSSALGKNNIKVAGITDNGFARSIISKNQMKEGQDG